MCTQDSLLRSLMHKSLLTKQGTVKFAQYYGYKLASSLKPMIKYIETSQTRFFLICLGPRGAETEFYCPALNCRSSEVSVKGLLLKDCVCFDSSFGNNQNQSFNS